MLQSEFNQFYDRLRAYAQNRAKKLFYDVALRQEAVDIALDRAIDWLLKDKKAKSKEAFCKKIIANSLYNSHTRRKIEPVSLKGTEFNIWGFRGRKLKD